MTGPKPLTVLPADDLHDSSEIGDTKSSTSVSGSSGCTVPTGLAGYVHGGEAYCTECAKDVTVSLPDGSEEVPVAEYPTGITDPNGEGVGIVSTVDEWDYPGGVCGVCGDYLDTQVIIYDGGGAHPERYATVTDPYDGSKTGEAFILEKYSDGGAKVIVGEDIGNTFTKGEITELEPEFVEIEADLEAEEDEYDEYEKSY